MTSEEFIEKILHPLGVRDSLLSSSEKHSLDADGFVVFNTTMENSLLERLRADFERFAALQKQSLDDRRATGTRHVKNLLRAGNDFVKLTAHPKLLAAVFHLLQNAFRLLHFDGRDPLPGYGQQGLHTDWTPRHPDMPFQVATAICLLDDFTDENGSTRIVPATHLKTAPVPKSLADPLAHHRDEIRVTAAAGSTLVFNGHLWHSGTRNNSKSSRRVLQCQYVLSRRNEAHIQDPVEYISGPREPFL